MSIDLQCLVELERLDREIANLENSKMEFPKKVTDMEATLQEKKANRSMAQGKLDVLLNDIRKCEQSLTDNQHGLDTSHDRLNLVKTNREYDAILLEITERKEMIERDRKKNQKFAEKKSVLEKELADATELYENTESELQPIIDELTAKIGSIDDDVVVVKIKRDIAVKDVPEDFLTEYNRIHEKRKNARVLCIVNDKSAACSHCHQVINARIRKNALTSDSPILCENCGSIIVWQEIEYATK